MAASDLLDLVAAMCRQPRLSLELIRFLQKDIFVSSVAHSESYVSMNNNCKLAKF